MLPGFTIITLGWFIAWIMILFLDGWYGTIDPDSVKPIIVVFSVMVLLFVGETFLFLIYAAYNGATK